MKNQKIDLAEVREGRITSGEHIKAFKKGIQTMEGKFASPENSVPFFLKLEQEFDKKALDTMEKASKDFFMVLGTRKSDWKLYIKECFKENPKNILVGTCYLEGLGEAKKLILQANKGQAGLTKIRKAAKSLCKRAGLNPDAIEMGMEQLLADEEGEDDPNPATDAAYDQMEAELQSASDSAQTQTQGPAEVAAALAKIIANQKELKALVDGIQNAKSNEEIYQNIGSLYAGLNTFEQSIEQLKKLDPAHPALAKSQSNLLALRKMGQEKFGKVIEFIEKVKAEAQKLNDLMKSLNFEDAYMLAL